MVKAFSTTNEAQLTKLLEEQQAALAKLQQRFGRVAEWLGQCSEIAGWAERHGRLPRRHGAGANESALAGRLGG